jgi:flagellar hook assembly protein FlgD
MKQIYYLCEVDPVYFKPAFTGNPYLPMNLYILSASIGNKPASIGTEVGIYDNDICVGSAVIVETLESESSYLSIPVSQDDPTTEIIDGYIPGSKIDVRVFDGEREYVAHVGDLVFTSQGTEVMSVDIPTGPTSYKLYSNYPNPFNPTTTIRFDLPYKSVVSVKVYDLQGREVMSLIDGNMDSGYHSVRWNAEAMSSGVYLIALKSGDKSLIEKVVLLK